MKKAVPISLSSHDQAQLDGWVRGPNIPQRFARRARIILLAAAGRQNQEIARELGVSRPTVQLWRDRFLAQGVEGLRTDRPRPGRARTIGGGSVRRIMEATLQASASPAAPVSARSLAESQGMSEGSVRRIWRRYAVNPPLRRLSAEGRLHALEELHEALAALLAPPENALVIFISRQELARALARSAAGAGAGESADGPERGAAGPQTHRQGCIRLFRRIDNELPAEADRIVIIEQHAVLEHRQVRSWLEKHPRFRLSVIPALRSQPSGPHLIRDYITAHAHDPRVLAWSGEAATAPPAVPAAAAAG